jgi:carbonic anhydrase/acetyltransferase-like protein (isoleucine patch superfamily)
MIRKFEDKEPQIDPTAFIAETAVVIGDVVIGERSSIWYGTVVRGDVNYIRIGARTNIQDNSVIHVTGGTHPTIIEDEVTAGHRVTLHGCHIESGCLIGIGAILLDGVRVGKNSLVAAGSLLTPRTQVPPGSLVMGSPAKVVRNLSETELTDLPKFWQNYTKIIDRYSSKG